MIITQYSIRVSAENALGEGEPSGKQTVKTLQEAPEGGDVLSHFGDQKVVMLLLILEIKGQPSQFFVWL